MIKQFRFVPIALVACLAWAATAQAQTLNGKWRVTSGTLHGNTVPSSVLNLMSLDFSASTFAATSQSLNSSGNYTVNNAASPAQITFTINAGAETGRTLKAIYQFQGQGLQITFSENDQFPTEFQSTGANRYLAMSYAQGAGGVGGVANNNQGALGVPPANAGQPGEGGSGAAGFERD